MLLGQLLSLNLLAEDPERCEKYVLEKRAVPRHWPPSVIKKGLVSANRFKENRFRNRNRINNLITDILLQC